MKHSVLLLSVIVKNLSRIALESLLGPQASFFCRMCAWSCGTDVENKAQAPCVSAFHEHNRMEAGNEADNTCASTVILLLYCIPEPVMFIKIRRYKLWKVPF